MKRFLCLLLSLTLLLLCGCGRSASAPQESAASQGPDVSQGPAASQGPSASQAPAAPAQSETRAEVFSQDEYMLYQNVFYNDYGPKVDGTQVEKEGVFAMITDAFNQRQRYYVWGYYDKTRCCDWQWEFVPDNPDALPAPGSLITVSGTFASAKDALDGYWIKDASFSTKQTYGGESASLDMAAMSCTLERVQMYNVMYKPEEFEGKDFTAYGRLTADSMLQDPYYDGSWQIGYSWDGSDPGIDRLCAVRGEILGGTLTVESLDPME